MSRKQWQATKLLNCPEIAYCLNGVGRIAMEQADTLASLPLVIDSFPHPGGFKKIDLSF